MKENNRIVRQKGNFWFRNSRVIITRLLLFPILLLSSTAACFMHGKAAEGTVSNWAFFNDGSLQYEDNESSWYSDMETVHAVEGMDINLNPARQNTDVFTRECVVALIDTGVDITHPALSGGLWKNTGEVPGDGIDNDGNGYIDDVDGWNFYKDTNGVYNSRSSTEDAHGTHCAGTIIANDLSIGVTGIAGGIDAICLMPVKTVGGSGQTGSVENLIKGIQYAEQNGAAVCNISLGFEKWNEEVYRVMKDSKMLFVTVAGNGESDTHGSGFDLGLFPRYPACYGLDNVIVVANLKCDGTLHYSSNYNSSYVDIAAPGTQIYSTSTHKSGYEVMTGTSMAAPMVSAAAALVYASHENWDVLQVKKALLASCRKLDALHGVVKTEGMLNVAAAISYTETPPSGEGEEQKETSPTEAEGEPSETPPMETEGEPSETPPMETEEKPTEMPPSGTGGESGEVRIPKANETPQLGVTLTDTKITSMVSDAKNQLTVRWKKVKGAGGYEVTYAEDKSFIKNKVTKKTAKTFLVLKKLGGNRTYYIRVRTYAGRGAKKIVGKYSAVRYIKLTPRPAKLGKVIVAPNVKKLHVTVGFVKGTDGYEIVLSMDKAGKKVVAQKSSARGRAVFIKLKKKKTYYVTVRAYRKTKNGGWLYSTKKVAKVKTK